MPSKTAPTWFSPEIAAYVAEHTTQPDDVLAALIERTREVAGDRAIMQVSPSQGSLLTLLTRVVGAGKALEIGTFTGYSSICIARGLAEGGHLLCCDVSEKYGAIAREAWADAGVDDRIELRIAPAVETLAALPSDTEFDLVFIDADKDNYLNYFEAVLPLLRTGGLVMIDNTLWSGNVVDENAEPGSVVAVIRTFNDAVAADPRVDSFILPVADGLTLAAKR
jgi:caffeoyl-CoA O-methyltransferase